ncbi:MAG: DNA-directed RNA polymerase subunit beta' [Planctomycetes bacterium]|nr:DNA-directed RNA polymerase subunit beta' [Planctomycetota bacterium]
MISPGGEGIGGGGGGLGFNPLAAPAAPGLVAERQYDRINDYTAVSISLASPNDIRSWSYGEVKKPETINYRSYRAEKDGLFCERIFGPERDWECSCGKYKGIKYKDIICDRCGVKVTHSKVRRSRFGHINLAAPVVHIWFFRALPSKLGALLGVKTTALQQVIYSQRFIVTDPGDTPLERQKLLTEEEYRKAREEYGNAFKAEMGAEAVRDLLKLINLPELAVELRQKLVESKSKQKTETYIKRLRIIEAMLASGNKPEWMVMDVIPVIPPDLRPLVPLESGNFATSDLNDLYRRVINRNNRLKKLLDLNAPGVIIRNEKRMLQQAVDALFDNGRCKRAVLGTGNRPLKSLTDMIKGKQGRFRENLLGKRVDYSARSVIVVGPNLKLDQVGLPKKIALELFQPFIIRRLKDQGYADTIKSAKKILERKDEEVWDVLEEVTKGHPVMLNRAPTLHRMGIQAFYPVLVEGDSIMIHPLVCAGFNADFDGDQMAVHLPLSQEAQVEACMLMISTNNIFSPAHGSPIITPDLDIVMGCYFLTSDGKNIKGEGMAFASKEEVFLAFDEGRVGKRAKIQVRIKGRQVIGEKGPQTAKNDRYTTTVGRVIFNDILPAGMPFYNMPLGKPQLKRVVSDCYQILSRPMTVELLDRLKDLGFHEATMSGLSFAASDLKIPTTKPEVIAEADKKVGQIQKSFDRGIITEGERYRLTIDVWTHVRDRIWKDVMDALKYDERPADPSYVNPIWYIVHSGARGNQAQVGQLCGIRGLMAKPSGEILETPIKANFREGLRGLEYFSSTHGARKGLADTALKTANSGYLTRKLVEVAQDVTIAMHDCGTQQGVTKGAVYRGETQELSLTDAIRGRVARDRITHLVTGETIVAENQLITPKVAQAIEEFLGRDGKIRVRSPLTCEASHGICQLCYGMDLSTGNMIEMGSAAGVIAAQSVGEPGTQLTMRTFHVGGLGHMTVEESEVRSKVQGIVKFQNVESVSNEAGEVVVLNRNAEILIVDEREREHEKYIVQTGSVLLVKDGEKIPPRKPLAKWDPHNTPILTEVGGTIAFEDFIADVTFREEADPGTGFKRKVIVEHRGDHHPQIVIKNSDGQIQGVYSMPEKAFIEVDEGDEVKPGKVLAKTPREISGTQDITGGLPRITELFEARKPKEPAIMAEIDGVVEFGDRKRGKRSLVIKSDSGIEMEHLVPQGKHILVRKGDRVRAGERLVDGALILHDILRISGVEKLQNYILNEIQAVYRSQSVRIDDRHIEILIRQMMRKVQINHPGDTEFLPTDVVSKQEFEVKNKEMLGSGKTPATASPMLLGIARASLQQESWIAAASFQETTKVLTEAAIAGRRDELRGLKENVILGHIIPAGTGFKDFLLGMVKREEAPALAEAAEKEMKELTASPAEGGGEGGAE